MHVKNVIRAHMRGMLYSISVNTDKTPLEAEIKTPIVVTLNDKRDADVIAWLKEIPNGQVGTTIKTLLLNAVAMYKTHPEATFAINNIDGIVALIPSITEPIPPSLSRGNTEEQTATVSVVPPSVSVQTTQTEESVQESETNNTLVPETQTEVPSAQEASISKTDDEDISEEVPEKVQYTPKKQLEMKIPANALPDDPFAMIGDVTDENIFDLL